MKIPWEGHPRNLWACLKNPFAYTLFIQYEYSKIQKNIYLTENVCHTMDSINYLLMLLLSNHAIACQKNCPNE